ncbi:cell division protein FtsZ [Delftia sp. PS-11]|uniref:cell division protein FtsZ n=1 Tax=Delftia sp. PS-11 TaxID=2767222 RepID=UPI0024550A39|nr:cell division protein FtsZ [Delftia sp. PS-11]KAJ8740753.1 cell division protein FtsZ [Delftia sp. PS-11]
MSTLQISLAVLGFVLLALIFAYNSWSARRNAPKRADPTDEAQRDAPRQEPGMDTVGHGPDLTHSLREPVLGDFGTATAGQGAGRFAETDAELAHLMKVEEQRRQADAQAALAAKAAQAVQSLQAAETTISRDEPSSPQAASATGTATEAAAPAAAPAAAHAANRPGLDALIDAIATVQVAQAVPGELALQAQPATRRAGNKPFAIEGMNPLTHQWEPLQPGQRYLGFQAGVQLANRTGALNEIEFSEFVAKVQRFADALGTTPDLPDMLNEVARARELDQFANEHDAQLTFMLRARQASWSAGYVQQNASRQGFLPGSMPGRMALPSPTPGMPPVLVLNYDPQAAMADDLDTSVVREFLLSLDVPQVPRGEQPFARLRQVAERLCQTMDGVLCDQNGYLLPAMALDPIQNDLEQLYDKLDSRELSAGSMLARRLFS